MRLIIILNSLSHWSKDRTIE